VLKEYNFNVDGDVDRYFEQKFKGIEYVIEKSEKNVVEVVENLINEGFRKIVIYRNTVNSLCNTYKEMIEKFKNRDMPVYIIHGRMPAKNKLSTLSRISKEKAYILLSTQVLEAGVDISFEAGVSPLASPSSLVQRIGRVCRYGKDAAEKRCKFVILMNDNDGAGSVYPENVMELVKEFHIVDGWRWRLFAEDGKDYSLMLLKQDEILKNYWEKREEVSKARNEIREVLNTLSQFHIKPFEALRMLDNVLKGSFVRSSYIIQLIPEEVVNVLSTNYVKPADLKRVDECAIEVSLDFLEKRLAENTQSVWRKAMIVDDGKLRLVFVATLYTKDGVFRQIHSRFVDAKHFINKPLEVLWRSHREVRRESHRGMESRYAEEDVDEESRIEIRFLGVATKFSEVSNEVCGIDTCLG